VNHAGIVGFSPIMTVCLSDTSDFKKIDSITNTSIQQHSVLASVLLIEIPRERRCFQVRAAKLNVVSDSLQKRAWSPTAQPSDGDAMKTLRVVKRGSKDNKDDIDVSAPTKPRLTTEMIVKRWIVQSREHRRAAMSQLQSSMSWKELGGLARG
jgi:hypothetical protein